MGVLTFQCSRISNEKRSKCSNQFLGRHSDLDQLDHWFLPRIVSFRRIWIPSRHLQRSEVMRQALSIALVPRIRTPGMLHIWKSLTSNKPKRFHRSFEQNKPMPSFHVSICDFYFLYDPIWGFIFSHRCPLRRPRGFYFYQSCCL